MTCKFVIFSIAPLHARRAFLLERVLNRWSETKGCRFDKLLEGMWSVEELKVYMRSKGKTITSFVQVFYQKLKMLK